MTITRQVQPPRLRLRYRALQSAAILAMLLGAVLWFAAFAKRIEEAEESQRLQLIRGNLQQMHSELIDLERRLRDMRVCEEWQHVTWARCLP